MDLVNMPTAICKLKTRSQVLNTLTSFDYGVISPEYYQLIFDIGIKHGKQLWFLKKIENEITKLKKQL